VKLLESGKGNDGATIILSHGAGAPMDSPFMAFFANGLAEKGHYVLRFEFPYMQRHRAEGTKRPPDRQPKLLECWKDVIDQVGQASNLIISGKSMGGRMASLIADEMQVKGLVCLGYPFHAPGKMDKPRTEHLQDLKTPTLILQGERDAMGSCETVSGYTLSDAIEIKWLPDGDHSFKPRKKSGHTEEQNWTEAIHLFDKFVRRL
jgi:uncharacterized protein